MASAEDDIPPGAAGIPFVPVFAVTQDMGQASEPQGQPWAGSNAAAATDPSDDVDALKTGLVAGIDKLVAAAEQKWQARCVRAEYMVEQLNTALRAATAEAAQLAQRRTPGNGVHLHMRVMDTAAQQAAANSAARRVAELEAQLQERNEMLAQKAASSNNARRLAQLVLHLKGREEALAQKDREIARLTAALRDAQARAAAAAAPPAAAPPAAAPAAEASSAPECADQAAPAPPQPALAPAQPSQPPGSVHDSAYLQRAAPCKQGGAVRALSFSGADRAAGGPPSVQQTAQAAAAAGGKRTRDEGEQPSPAGEGRPGDAPPGACAAGAAKRQHLHDPELRGSPQAQATLQQLADAAAGLEPSAEAASPAPAAPPTDAQGAPRGAGADERGVGGAVPPARAPPLLASPPPRAAHAQGEGAGGARRAGSDSDSGPGSCVAEFHDEDLVTAERSYFVDGPPRQGGCAGADEVAQPVDGQAAAAAASSEAGGEGGDVWSLPEVEATNIVVLRANPLAIDRYALRVPCVGSGDGTYVWICRVTSVDYKARCIAGSWFYNQQQLLGVPLQRGPHLDEVCEVEDDADILAIYEDDAFFQLEPQNVGEVSAALSRRLELLESERLQERKRSAGKRR